MISKLIVFAYTVFAVSIASGSDLPQGEITDSTSLVTRLTASLASTKSTIHKNAIIKLRILNWQLNGGDAKMNADTVSELSKKLQFMPPNASLSEAREAANKYEQDIGELLGSPTLEYWDIVILEGSIKFVEKVDPKIIEMLKSKSDDSLTTKFDTTRQWLFTEKTVYEYRDGDDVLNVKPLDPFSTAYPVRLDILNVSFALRPEMAKLFSRALVAPISDHKNNFFLTFGTTGKSSMSVAIDDADFSITSLKVGNTDVSSTERFYLHTVKGLLSGFLSPITVTNIDRASDSANIAVYSVDTYDFGSAKSEMLGLRIPKSAAISSSVETGPIKFEN